MKLLFPTSFLTAEQPDVESFIRTAASHRNRERTIQHKTARRFEGNNDADEGGRSVTLVCHMWSVNYNLCPTASPGTGDGVGRSIVFVSAES